MRKNSETNFSKYVSQWDLWLTFCFGIQTHTWVVGKTVYTYWGRMPLWWLYQKHFFLPKHQEQLLIEMGIPCNNLIPSYFESNFSPWIDPAVPSPCSLLLIYMMDLFHIATVQMVQPWLHDARFGSVEDSEGLCTLSKQPSTVSGWHYVLAWLQELRQPQIWSKVLFELFPHGLLCWQGHQGHAQVVEEGWWAISGPQGAGYSGCTTGTTCLQAPLNTSVFAHWNCSC